jgi:Leucine rich repeat
VVLTGNRLVRIESDTLRHLPSLVTVVLNHNCISAVEPQAFVHLDGLQKLEQQFNLLVEFWLSSWASPPSDQPADHGPGLDLS